MNQNNEKLIHLRALSSALDTKFVAPGGFRFGLDGLLGLIPFVGDFITSGVSIYIIAQAASMGVGPSMLIRMAINVGVENLFDMIPLVGNLFDFYWKSNSKNMALLELHLDNPARETIKSRMIVGLLGFALIAVLLFSAYITFIVMQGLLNWLISLGSA